MYCPNCGEKVADGSRFCGSCGTKLEEVLAPEVEQPVQPTVEEPVQVESEASVAVVTKVTAEQPELVPANKKTGLGSKKLLLIGAVAVVAVLAIVIGLIAALSGGEKDNTYVYLADGDYQLLTDLKKGDSVEISSSRSDYQYASLVRFSPDGKYVYYYTKLDASTGTASLNRAEHAKLKKDSSRNEKYIDTIATNVQLGFRFFEDGTLAYINGDNNLYYYDGEDTNSVAKKVDNYYIDAAAGRIVYTTETGSEDDGRTLYGILTSDLDNKIKLASNVGYVYYITDFENIFYTKDVETETGYEQSLYVVGFEKEAEKIGNHVQVLSTGDNIVFTQDEGATISLYDYVTDDKASADAGITEPDRNDFSVPNYTYYRITSSSPVESDYTELYTSCTEGLYWFRSGRYWYSYYSMNNAVDMEWGENTEQINAATQAFIEKFADQADENGYILVTDEVKQALQKINGYADEPNENGWLWFCFNREQSGTRIDYDAYYAARDIYYEAAERIELREALQNPDNDFRVSSLYNYADGVKTLISDKVLNYSWCNNGIMYNTTDLITETKNLEEIRRAYEVQELFYLDNEAQNYLLPLTSVGAIQMGDDAAYAYAEACESGYAELTITDSAIFMQEGNDALSIAHVKDGVVGDFEYITDDGKLLDVNGEDVYYINGIYESGDATYGDLYLYTKGESVLKARDVVIDHYSYDSDYVGTVSINLYEDGSILAYTEAGYRGYELSLIDKKGESTVIADDVTKYIRVDESTLLFISDGDLFRWNGKEKTRLESDVDFFWCRNSMSRTVLY